MIIKIFEHRIEPESYTTRHFALFPTIVKEAHPTLKRRFLIWFEWYETDTRYPGKWLIENT